MIVGLFSPRKSWQKLYVPYLLPLCDISTQMLISQEPWVVPEYHRSNVESLKNPTSRCSVSFLIEQQVILCLINIKFNVKYCVSYF